MPILCSICGQPGAVVKLSASKSASCKKCFFAHVEEKVHRACTKLFNKGERIGIAISGGKDSTVLAHLLHLLNVKHNYELDLQLLAVDEGIAGYRDNSLSTVHRNSKQYNLPLTIVSYMELFDGWSMDKIVEAIGTRNNCTFCGVLRRQAMDYAGAQLRVDKMATGHNADDAAETFIMNLTRGDIGRFNRCSSDSTNEGKGIPRCKPLMFCYEKEIVLYAHFLKLDYFSTECTYSAEAYRGHARSFVKRIERADSQFVMGLLYSITQLQTKDEVPAKHTVARNCERCGMMSSGDICKACELLDGLISGNPLLAVQNSRGKKKKELSLT